MGVDRWCIGGLVDDWELLLGSTTPSRVLWSLLLRTCSLVWELIELDMMANCHLINITKK